jgi:hypothetical protein
MRHPKKCTCAICEARRNRKREKRERLAELNGELEAAEKIAAERQAKIGDIVAATEAEQPPPSSEPPAQEIKGGGGELGEIIKIDMGGQPAQITEQEAAAIATEAATEQPQPSGSGVGVEFNEGAMSQGVIGLMIGGVVNIVLIIIAYFIGVKTSNFDVVMLDDEEMEQIGEAATPYINKKLKNSEDFELYALLGGIGGIITKKAVVMIEVLKVQEKENEKMKAEIADIKKQLATQQQPPPKPQEQPQPSGSI